MVTITHRLSLNHHSKITVPIRLYGIKAVSLPKDKKESNDGATTNIYTGDR